MLKDAPKQDTSIADDNIAAALGEVPGEKIHVNQEPSIVRTWVGQGKEPSDQVLNPLKCRDTSMREYIQNTFGPEITVKRTSIGHVQMAYSWLLDHLESSSFLCLI